MSRVRKYEGKDVDVTYDAVRCLHAAECARSLPAVFDPRKRPWVSPDGADAERVIDTVRRCPTGALQAWREGKLAEDEPGANLVAAGADGPLFLRGHIVIRAAGEAPREEARVALCRCGRSTHKPLCDGSHENAGFRADGGAHPVAAPDGLAGPLEVTVAPDGPLVLKGDYKLRAGGGDEPRSGGALCRCGHSSRKPFCDGSHKTAGFRG